MKKLIFLNSILALSLIFQFCTKDEGALVSNVANQVNSIEETSERSNCNCNVQVIASTAGSLSADPWMFELSYINSSGNSQVLLVTANGTSNTPITIMEGTTQVWSFFGGNTGETAVNVSARVSCSGDGCKVCGPIRSYTVPANTPPWAIYFTGNSTNNGCDVEL